MRAKLVTLKPVLDRYPDFAALLSSGEDEEGREKIRKAETIGRPIGSSDWLEDQEKSLGRTLCPKKRGLKAKMAGMK